MAPGFADLAGNKHSIALDGINNDSNVGRVDVLFKVLFDSLLELCGIHAGSLHVLYQRERNASIRAHCNFFRQVRFFPDKDLENVIGLDDVEGGPDARGGSRVCAAEAESSARLSTAESRMQV